MRGKIILIIGVVLALVAAVLIIIYLQGVKQQAKEETEAAVQRTAEELKRKEANQAPILVAKKDIAAGATIDKDSLEVQLIPNEYIQPQAVTSLDRIAGMAASIRISKGEQITLSKLSSTGQDNGIRGGSLATSTPRGKRAVTISIDNIASVGGMVRPGDYVDISSMLALPGKQGTQAAIVPLFQNVLVLAMGQDTGAPRSNADSRYKKEDNSGGGGAAMVTVALSPQEANLLAFVQEQGKIRLTLRSTSDAQIEPMQPTSWNTLFQYIMPQNSEQNPSEEKGEFIEIYRGMNKDKIPLVNK